MTAILEKTKAFVVSPDFASVEGWLWDDAIFVTAAIMATMKKHGITGPNFEIGVYKGRYLAAMHHCAEHYYGEKQKSYGFDFFRYSKEHEHKDAFRKLFGTDRDVKVEVRSSLDARPEDIEKLCGGKPAFISIDGDHNEWPVLEDHTLCAEALKRGGVISSDDFSNWAMLGLMSGIARFFLSHNRHGLVPFVFSSNKLFSCHPVYAERYQEGIVAFCEANPDIPAAKRFLDGRANGMANVRHSFFGGHCLIL